MQLSKRFNGVIVEIKDDGQYRSEFDMLSDFATECMRITNLDDSNIPTALSVAVDKLLRKIIDWQEPTNYE